MNYFESQSPDVCVAPRCDREDPMDTLFECDGHNDSKLKDLYSELKAATQDAPILVHALRTILSLENQVQQRNLDFLVCAQSNNLFQYPSEFRTEWTDDVPSYYRLAIRKAFKRRWKVAVLGMVLRLMGVKIRH